MSDLAKSVCVGVKGSWDLPQPQPRLTYLLTHSLHFLPRSSHQDNLLPMTLTLLVDYTLQASLSM